jgi:hypothetical protein
MLQVPGRISYLMPVGSIARLFKRHNGKQAVAVKSAPGELDIAASRSENRVFLHVVNLSYARTVRASLAVEGRRIAGGRVFEIAPEDPREYVNVDQPGVFAPCEKPIPPGAPAWSFPKTSVSAVELELA